MLALVNVVIIFIVSRASDLVLLVKKLLGVSGWFLECWGGCSTLRYLKWWWDQADLLRWPARLSLVQRRPHRHTNVHLPAPEFHPPDHHRNWEVRRNVLFRSAKWFLAAYVRDVWSRLPALKDAVTSTFGTILKIDSTKVCRTCRVCVQTRQCGRPTWAMSEKSSFPSWQSESAIALQPMADGLVNRYSRASKPCPLVLFPNRGCC